MLQLLIEIIIGIIIIALLAYLVYIHHKPRLSLSLSSSSSPSIAFAQENLMASPVSRLLNPFIHPYRTPDTPVIWPYAYPDKDANYSHFQPVGYIASTENEEILPLFGRNLKGPRYQYYTITDNDIKIPIKTKQDEELTEFSDPIKLNGKTKEYKVYKYETGDKWL